jgi:hypothetical protein
MGGRDASKGIAAHAAIDKFGMTSAKLAVSEEGESACAPAFRWLVCALLILATTINFIDRQIRWILAPLLRKDIAWS